MRLTRCLLTSWYLCESNYAFKKKMFQEKMFITLKVYKFLTYIFL